VTGAGGGKRQDLTPVSFTNKNPLLNAVVGAVYRHGDVAEKVTGFVLQHSGLFSNEVVPSTGLPAMGPIQNRSGHGIDWIGRALTGKSEGEFLAVEAKGGLNGRAAGLSDRQRQLGVHKFVETRIASAINGQGYWAARNVEYGTQQFAKYVEQAMQFKSYEGILFQHHYMRSGHTSVRSSQWK
jgi:hypothetical protein